jgi:nitroreductase
MDARLVIASLRTVRSYLPEPLDDRIVERILDAGRLTSSARNRQPWRFIVVRGTARAPVARTVYVPRHVMSAGLVVAIAVTPGGNLVDFDAGRAAQSMMLAAWDEGVGSCPNGVADHAPLTAALELAGQERVPIVISFGLPERASDPRRRTPERWSEVARRLPLERVVRYVGEAE